MDAAGFKELLKGSGDTDYEIYLNTPRLLACQKDPDDLVHHDEMQFQIVHQIEEMLMKLAAHTLLKIIELMPARETNRILTLFHRVAVAQRQMISLFDLLDTMSPKDYQIIRAGLGGGSGRESPGFRALMTLAAPLWEGFRTHYLEGGGLSLDELYDTGYSHDDAYMVAEALAAYDALALSFRQAHLRHVARSIGLGAKSLKGRPVEMLKAGLAHRMFPELWRVRDRMSGRWAGEYGEVRKPLAGG